MRSRYGKTPGEPLGSANAVARLTMPRIPDHERSEEHTSELQSQSNIVCRLLLEKKKQRPADLRFQPLCIILPDRHSQLLTMITAGQSLGRALDGIQLRAGCRHADCEGRTSGIST